MRRLGKYITGCLAVSLLTVHVADAQIRGYEGDIAVIPVRFEKSGETLYVEMDIRLTDMHVKSPVTVELTPRITTGELVNDLPAVLIKGRHSYKAYERGVAMKHGGENHHIAVKGYGRDDKTIRYRHAMPYKPWMIEAKIVLLQAETGCGHKTDDRVLLSENVLLTKPDAPILALPLPVMPFVRPVTETVKNREIQAECRLDFVVNRTDINPEYMNNPRELAKIRRIIDELHGDPSITITGLEIVGYASPEGSLENNRRLSEGRSMALRNYLASRYDFPRSAYKVSFGGENWDGLVEALHSYPMEYNDEILEIIDRTSPGQIRKDRLAALRGGAPYREMLRYVYPGLRSAVCVIDYRIKGFDIHEAVEVFNTRPQNLSLNEFYLVSETMQEGSWDFAEVFETAVRMYPEDEIANLNAAIAALRSRNVEVAERYLAKVIVNRSLPEYLNAMGAAAMIREDYVEAERFFRQAAPRLDAARRNLETLRDKTN